MEKSCTTFILCCHIPLERRLVCLSSVINQSCFVSYTTIQITGFYFSLTTQSVLNHFLIGLGPLCCHLALMDVRQCSDIESMNIIVNLR